MRVFAGRGLPKRTGEGYIPQKNDRYGDVDGYWEELAAFTRSLFNATFKTNPWLERAIMTGITRVSRKSDGILGKYQLQQPCQETDKRRQSGCEDDDGGLVAGEFFMQ